MRRRNDFFFIFSLCLSVCWSVSLFLPPPHSPIMCVHMQQPVYIYIHVYTSVGTGVHVLYIQCHVYRALATHTHSTRPCTVQGGGRGGQAL